MYQVKVVLTDSKGKISKQHIFQSMNKTNSDEVFKNIVKEMYKTFSKIPDEIASEIASEDIGMFIPKVRIPRD